MPGSRTPFPIVVVETPASANFPTTLGTIARINLGRTRIEISFVCIFTPFIHVASQIVEAKWIRKLGTVTLCESITELLVPVLSDPIVVTDRFVSLS